VSQLREASQPDVAPSIRAIAAEHEGFAIHLDLPDTLSVDDRSRAEALLRCVQEIVTNTARHAHAHNLWIRMELRPGGIALHARDDGRGAQTMVFGHGLTGMRERFEQYSGHIEFSAGHGTGFEVRGFLPLVLA
jgi:signal transduction histidine kinase